MWKMGPSPSLSVAYYKPGDDLFKLFNAAEGLDQIFCDSPKNETLWLYSCASSQGLSPLRYHRATVANAHFTSGVCLRQLMAGFRQITQVPQSPSVNNQSLKWSPDISFGDTMGLIFVAEWNVLRNCWIYYHCHYHSKTLGICRLGLGLANYYDGKRGEHHSCWTSACLASSLWACWHAAVSVEPRRATSTAVSLWCCFNVLHFSDICKLIEVIILMMQNQHFVCLLTHHN